MGLAAGYPHVMCSERDSHLAEAGHGSSNAPDNKGRSSHETTGEPRETPTWIGPNDAAVMRPPDTHGLIAAVVRRHFVAALERAP